MSGIINDTSFETEFASAEDPPNIHRTLSNETIFYLRLLI